VHQLELAFDKNKLVMIRCYAGEKLGRCPALGGIRDDDSEQQLVQKFGPATPHQSMASQRRYGAFFCLTQETVYMLGINDTRYKWGRSK
jgi:hypothetical protein